MLTLRSPLPRAMLLAVTSLVAASVGVLLWPGQPLAADIPDFAPIRALAHWDAGWYETIATDGYWYHPGQQSPVAFFPLYPLTIRALAWLGINRWVSAELLSLVFGLAGIAVFSRWARKVLPTSADTATLLLIVYPFSVYLYGIIYSDGLFLLCVSAAFLALESDRPALATLFGALSTACRPVALGVVVGLVVRAIERRKRRGETLQVADFIPLLAIAGLLGWMVFLQLKFDDPLAWVHVQSAPGWDQPPGWESWLKISWFKTLFPKVSPLVAVRLGGHALATLTGLALVVPTFKRLGWGYAAYCLVVVGIPAVSSKDFMGLGRYLIAGFPLFLTAGSLLDERPKVKRAFVVASVSIFVFCAVAFGAGGYVA